MFNCFINWFAGLIHVGDVIYEVNGISVRGKDPDEVVGLLVSHS